MEWTQRSPSRERFFTIREDQGNYQLHIPHQRGFASQVRYLTDGRPAVAEFHSHGSHPAHFSATDKADEQGCRIYGIIGRLDLPIPELTMRLGIYGYFKPLEWSQVCDYPEHLPYHPPPPPPPKPTGTFPR